MDLSIIIQQNGQKDNIETIIQKVRCALKLGYETVALNCFLDSKHLDGKNKIPEPVTIPIGEDESTEARICGKTFRVLSRLTAVVSETIHCHRLMLSAVAKKYDILAVQPVNKKVFEFVCGNVDIDIICLDMTTKFPFTLRYAQIGQAIQRANYFEIQYSSCIRDTTVRRNTLSNSQLLTKVCKGKNIIVSSGARKVMELRGPNDVANLGLIFGLKDNQAKDAVRRNCRSVINHAETRKKTGRGVVSVEETVKLSISDKWLENACDFPGGYQAFVKPDKNSMDVDESCDKSVEDSGVKTKKSKSGVKMKKGKSGVKMNKGKSGVKIKGKKRKLSNSKSS